MTREQRTLPAAHLAAPHLTTMADDAFNVER
jgi:hypothetical protein